MKQIVTKDCLVQALDSRGSAAVLSREKISQCQTYDGEVFFVKYDCPVSALQGSCDAFFLTRHRQHT